MVNSSNWPLILKYTHPYFLERGVYGRIDPTAINKIAQVCKAWRNWICSPEGPFASFIGQVAPPPHVPLLNALNRCLYKTGKKWFKIVETYTVEQTPRDELFYDPDINCINHERKTPLHEAIDVVAKDISKLPLIEYLIRNHADPNLGWKMYSGDAISSTCLLHTFRKNEISIEQRIAIANALLAKGYSVNSLDADGFGFLHRYRYLKDDGKIIEWYRDKGGDVNLKLQGGRTPLQYLLRWLYKEDVDAVKRLIAAGVDIEAADPEKNTPLHLIVKEYDRWHQYGFNLISLILEKQPQQFYSVDADGYIPLWWAVKEGYLQAQKILLEFEGIDRLYVPTKVSLLGAFLEYVKEGYLREKWLEYDQPCNTIQFAINFRDEVLEGKYLNPLFTLLNKLEVRDLSLLPLDNSGNTFFHLLAPNCPILLDLLAGHLSNPGSVYQLKNKQGQTVSQLKEMGENTKSIILACDQGEVEKVLGLLEEPIDWAICDMHNNSLLHIAAARYRTSYKDNVYKILKLLLKKGLNPNQRNTQGQTPLSFFSMSSSRHDKAAILLQDYGATI